MNVEQVEHKGVQITEIERLKLSCRLCLGLNSLQILYRNNYFDINS